MAKRRANGEGTLRKRSDGRWECSIMVGWKEDGRRQIKSFYGWTQEEVMQKVQKWKGLHPPTFLRSKEYMFSEWADIWYASHRANIALTTQESYSYTLRALKQHFGRRKISQLKAHDVDIYLQLLRKRGLAKSTIAQYRGMLFQIMHKAEANDLIHKNPVRFATRVRDMTPPKKKEAFTTSEVQTLFQQLPYDRIGMSIRLLLGTGMRTQELLALEPRHIKEDGSEILIEQATQVIKGTVAVGVPKTMTSNRKIPVPPMLYSCAQALRDTPNKFIWEEKIPGKPCNPTYFRDQFRKTLEAIPTVRLLTPHSCRHTYVSQLQAVGVDVSTIQSIVGHAEIEMTEYYLHVQDMIKRDAVNKFSAAFSVEE